MFIEREYVVELFSIFKSNLVYGKYQICVNRLNVIAFQWWQQYLRYFAIEKLSSELDSA